MSAAPQAAATLDDRIRAAIGQVMDPCSVSAGSPISVLDMGMVLGWAVDRLGRVEVRMQLTSPGCTLAPSFMLATEEALRATAGVSEARVCIVDTVLWSEARMEPAALARLQARREESRRRVPIQPQQWRQAAPAELARARIAA